MRDKYDDLGDYVIAYLQETPKHRFDTVTKLGVSLRAKGIKVPQNDLALKAKVRIIGGNRTHCDKHEGEAAWTAAVVRQCVRCQAWMVPPPRPPPTS